MGKGSKDKLNVGIIWANPYNLNLGVAALAYSAIAIIKDIADEYKCDINLTVIGSSKYRKEKLIIRNKTYEFDNIKGEDYFSFKSLIKFILFYKQYRIHKLLNFNYIFDVGEGDSFSDIYGKKRFNRINNSKILFNKLNKKVILLPQTIGPFSLEKNMKKAVESVKYCEQVLARDIASYNYARDIFKDKSVINSIDLAFYLPYNKLEFKVNKINVGLNISGLLWMGGYTKKNQFGLKTDYKELTFKLIDFFLKKEDVLLHLIPHVVTTENDVEGDVSICKEIKIKYPQIILPDLFKNPIEAKSYISGLDFFAGARMHSCIAAFSSNVPVVPIAYSRKFNGLFIDTLGYEYMADCVNSTTLNVFNTITNSFYNRNELKLKIKQANEEIVDSKIRELKSIIKRIINGE